MSEDPTRRPDPRRRPADPAGTRPRHDPDALLPRGMEPLVLPSSTESERPSPDHVAAAARPPDAGRGAHSARFQFLMGALAAVAVAAVAMTAGIVLRDGGTEGSGPVWSPWRPTADGGAGAAQIAAHVGRRYRLPDGHQLVAVQGGPLEVADLPVTVAVRESADRGGDIKLIEGAGVMYRLCGLGPKCSIPYGKPSQERHLLLRREALELALYSFRYLDVEDVAVLMPPPPGEEANLALFFRKDDVRGVLDRPLEAVLPTPVPSLAKIESSPNAGFVHRLTSSKLFTFSLTQITLDNRALLVLDRFTGRSESSTGGSGESRSDGSRGQK